MYSARWRSKARWRASKSAAGKSFSGRMRIESTARIERGITSPVFGEGSHSSAPPRKSESRMPIVSASVMSL